MSQREIFEVFEKPYFPWLFRHTALPLFRHPVANPRLISVLHNYIFELLSN